MDPQQQQPWQQQQTPPQDYSIDYLNQISQPIKQSRSPNKLVLAIVGTAGLLAIGGFVMMLFSSMPTSLDKTVELHARLGSLQTLAKNQHRHLRDNGLRANNTAYQLFLTNAISDIEAPLQAAGIKKSSIPKSITDSEKTLVNELTAEFDNAKLNVLLDRTYAREMTYQLSVLQTMMKSVYNSTNSAELRSYIDTTSNNLTPIAESFSKFGATK